VKLRYTPPALADLDAILEYLDGKSPRGAAKVKSRIQTVINLLLQHPLSSKAHTHDAEVTARNGGWSRQSLPLQRRGWPP
jgi:plasmid stabilization system protein ParE